MEKKTHKFLYKGLKIPSLLKLKKKKISLLLLI